MQIDIDAPAIKAENAATKIQAGFRGYRVRKQLKECSDSGNNYGSADNNNTMASIIDSGNSTNENNDDIEEKSATKIQAGVRGFLVRKKQKIVGDAATKIQAGFRGFKVRKELQAQKNEEK